MFDGVYVFFDIPGTTGRHKLRSEEFTATENNFVEGPIASARNENQMVRSHSLSPSWANKMWGFHSVLTSLVSRGKYNVRTTEAYARYEDSSVTVSHYLWQTLDSTRKRRSEREGATLRAKMMLRNAFCSDVCAPFLFDTKICRAADRQHLILAAWLNRCSPQLLTCYMWLIN